MTEADMITALTVSLFLAGIVLTALVFVIFLQRKKIESLSKPAYGFLGKPLMILLVIGSVGLFAGAFGVTNISQQTPPSVPVSDQLEFEVQIVPTIISQPEGIVQFNAIPYLRGNPWGADPGQTFVAYWTIDQGAVRERVEYGISERFQGGIIETVTANVAIITVRVEMVQSDGETLSATQRIEYELPAQ